jgi:aminopeptidase N
MKRILFQLPLFTLFILQFCRAQHSSSNVNFTRQDSLRGSITPERAWWDVSSYGITVEPDFKSRSIKGEVILRFRVLQPGIVMQIDLQEPLKIVEAKWKKGAVTFTRNGNVYLLRFPESMQKGADDSIHISYSGKPHEAIYPPWNGGWIWKTDRNGNPWMSVACQGMGASVWYPCKDHQSDEPDSVSLTMIVPPALTGVGNGRLTSVTKNKNGTTRYTWSVKNPINNYNIIPYIGKYVNWKDTIMGLNGKLDCSYWVLDYNLDAAREQFKQVPQIIKCLEHWFGPYPFYEDSYKLVESPHLGMEHQSAVAYGNGFRNGYLGRDLSGTGWGLKWDYIAMHESGHEWFGNNVTTADIADMWVHESFTTYSETLFTECLYGKEAGIDYVTGIRKSIVNDIPITGVYGVNKKGSGDMYFKGSNMIQMIRAIINDDEKFRKILQGINKTFYHSIVTGKQVEEYINQQSGKDFSRVFDQYLRTVQVPVLEYRFSPGSVNYRWTNCVDRFNMPVRVNFGKELWIEPGTEWKSLALEGVDGKTFAVDRRFYIGTKQVK